LGGCGVAGAAACCGLSARTGCGRAAGAIGAAALATPESVVGDNMALTLRQKGKETVNQTPSACEISRSIRAASARSASTSPATAADKVSESPSRTAARIIRKRVSSAAMP